MFASCGSFNLEATAIEKNLIMEALEITVSNGSYFVCTLIFLSLAIYSLPSPVIIVVLFLMLTSIVCKNIYSKTCGTF